MDLTAGIAPAQADSGAQPFKIAPGFLILNEASLVGHPPKGDRLAAEFFKAATAIRKQVYFVLGKHGVSTPFGYYTNAEGRDAILAYVEEVAPAVAEMNRACAPHFRLSVNVVDVAADPSNDPLNRRLQEYTAERLEALRDRLKSLDPKTHKTTLVYSQDANRHLAMYCRGAYARAVQAAIREAVSTAALLRREPARAGKVTTPAIDSAIALLTGGAA